MLAVSIHAPHEGERLEDYIDMLMAETFQSTLPTRGSDYSTLVNPGVEIDVSIHAPHEGERR